MVTQPQMDAAAIKEFENDLRGMSLSRKRICLQEAQDIVDEQMPWIEALNASIRQDEVEER